MGILYGRGSIPHKWTDPLGDKISTIALNTFPRNLKVPRTLDELTGRTVSAALEARMRDPTILRISRAPTAVDESFKKNLSGSEYLRIRVWNRPEYYQEYSYFNGVVVVEYPDSPSCVPRKPFRVVLHSVETYYDSRIILFKWTLPEGWTIEPGPEFAINSYHGKIECTIHPGPFTASMEFIPLTVMVSGRSEPVTLNIPFQLAGSIDYNSKGNFPEHYDLKARVYIR